MEKKWNRADAFVKMVRPLSLITMIFAGLSLTGYAFGVEGLYRPISHGAATNPLTAMCLVLVGLSLYGNKEQPYSSIIQGSVSIVVLCMASIRIIDVLQKTNLSSIITPFYEVVVKELAQGKSNSMGINTALMLFSVSLSIFFYKLNLKSWSQFVASISLVFPMTTFLGYAYGMDKFYGQMSMLTASIGAVVTTSTLFLTADLGVLNLLLSSSKHAKSARFHFSLGHLLPILVGYFLVKTLVTTKLSMLSLGVISLCWLSVLFIAFWAWHIESSESKEHQNKSGIRA